MSDESNREAGVGDDDLLGALRDAAREVVQLDARWMALAEGRLAPAEVEVLRQEACQTEEGRSLWELFRPFDAGEHEQLFLGVRAALRSHRREEAYQDTKGDGHDS